MTERLADEQEEAEHAAETVEQLQRDARNFDIEGKRFEAEAMKILAELESTRLGNIASRIRRARLMAAQADLKLARARNLMVGANVMRAKISVLDLEKRSEEARVKVCAAQDLVDSMVEV